MARGPASAFFILAVLAVTAPALCGRTDERPRQAISVLVENDVLFLTDRYYTNGLSIAWTQTGTTWPWLRRLLDRAGLPAGPYVETLGFEVGQIISTPVATEDPAPQPEDRPWAGLLFAGPTLQVDDGNSLYGAKLFLGVVGPSSLAARTQTEFHRIVGSYQPRGWHNQLQDEPAIGLVGFWRRRVPLLGTKDGWALQALPSVGLSLGNVITKADAGLQLRVGWRLPSDYGTSTIGSSGNLPPPRIDRPADQRWGLSAFFGVTGSAAAHNVFLDGNTFRSSPSVQRYPFYGGFEYGVAYTGERLRLAVTTVRQTRQFTAQIGPQDFDSFSFTWIW